jgi:hypothetical protein
MFSGAAMFHVEPRNYAPDPGDLYLEIGNFVRRTERLGDAQLLLEKRRSPVPVNQH